MLYFSIFRYKRRELLNVLNTKNNLYNICLSLKNFSPAGIGGFFLPRASLLQRAEAGEGLTPDDAVRTSGGVSAGGHDLRDPRRHTWRRDAETQIRHIQTTYEALSERDFTISAKITRHKDDRHSAGEEG